MVEIYNEEVYDLLGDNAAATSPPKGADSGQQWTTNGVITPFQPATTHPSFLSRRPLGEIRHGEHGVYLRNVASVAVQSPDDVVAVMARGDSNRAVLGMSLEEHCSRSHGVVLMDVSRRSRIDGHVDEGRLVLVDLAGSERLIKNDACGGPRLREAQHINKSLSALEDVVNAAGREGQARAVSELQAHASTARLARGGAQPAAHCRARQRECAARHRDRELAQVCCARESPSTARVDATQRAPRDQSTAKHCT
ncbi:hypothetical protein PINS_up023881 [Pythium insidiosum]|nr:hypothetical protein PINS_up023881 [Pythium insidiosum]